MALLLLPFRLRRIFTFSFTSFFIFLLFLTLNGFGPFAGFLVIPMHSKDFIFSFSRFLSKFISSCFIFSINSLCDFKNFFSFYVGSILRTSFNYIFYSNYLLGASIINTCFLKKNIGTFPIFRS